MPTQNWSFTRNQFEIATASSYKAANKLGNFTLTAITSRIPPPSFVGGPSPTDVFAMIKSLLEPLVDDFDTKYKAWINQNSSKKSQVSALAEKLSLLAGVKINRWDLVIQVAFGKGSQEYINLLPNRKSPFQKGGQQKIIAELGAFRDRVADSSLPNDFKTEVTDFYESIQGEFDKSNAQKSKTTTASDNVEMARIALCKGLYFALGNLMGLYMDNPTQIEAFFDLQTLRNIEQSTFRHAVKKKTTVEVMKHTFEGDDEVRIENDGKVALKFYLSATPSGAPGAKSVTVEPEGDVKVKASDLGDINGHYLLAKNEDEEKEGHYVVTLL